MEFREGTDVVTAGGEKVGEIERVVIDPRTREVTHIVVEKGFLFTESRVLPIQVVQSADGERVVLDPRVEEDLESWPIFEERYTIPIEEARAADLERDPAAPRPARPLYWYPPLVAGDAGYLGMPYYPATVVEVERNVPEGAAALKPGAKIYSADDEHVGNVERVFTDSRTDAITHFLISRGLLFKNYKLVPANWVVDATDDAVYLSVTKTLLERLPDYTGD